MTGSDDDRMDEMLIQGARDYNTPGPVPREEMWGAITAARRQDRATTNATPPGAAPRPAKRSVWLAAGIGIAAALLLSTGIVIGRRTTESRTNERPGPTVAATDTPSATAPVPSVPKADTLLEQLRDETRRTNAKARELAEASPARRPTSPATTGAATGDFEHGNTLALQLVVMRHLAGSEAMITSFRSTARQGERDPMMAEWSKELLSTTRTLEASRVADDPEMKRLLDDLDLVISQIVQYATKGATNSEELDLIEQSINRRGVITKLRSTLPARRMSAGL